MEVEFEIEFTALPLKDLQDEYGKLIERYRQLRGEAEVDAQRIHELKRNLDTATAAEAYLSQELEQLTQALADSKTLSKAQTELEELRRKHHTLSTDYVNLQQDYECLRDENTELVKELELLKATKQQDACATVDTALAEEQANRLCLLEQENMELLQKLEEFQENSVRQTMALADKEKNIEILRDQVNCLEENLRSKREDLDEKTNLLESTQEQLADANARLAMLTTTPDHIDRKGNSLFAEVDDQRQAMKQLLAAQKKSYLQMKKIFNDSQYEIRRLKRENIAMHTELRECSSIFCNADKTYQDKLKERIQHLLSQVDALERQLSLTQEGLKELASEKGVEWLNSMLNYCKQETNDLKLQLHSVRIQNASLEEQLRNVQQDMARWRFESLKSRCVLLDREDLLNKHGISFKPMNALEYHISVQAQETARPRIVHVTPSKIATADDVIKLENTLESTTDNIESISSSIADISLISEQTPRKDLLSEETVRENNENTPPKTAQVNAETEVVIAEQSPLPLAIEHHTIKVRDFTQESHVSPAKRAPNLPKPLDPHKIRSPVFKSKQKLSRNVTTKTFQSLHTNQISAAVTAAADQSPDFHNKQESSAHSDEALLMSPTLLPTTNSNKPLFTKCAKKLPHAANVQPGPSILSKGRDIFSQENCEKNVQFSAQAPTVHDISNDTSLLAGNDAATLPNVVDSNDDVRQHKVTIKQVRTKSNVIVRRVVLGAKQEKN